MFGYVKAYKPELKMAEYETYKAVYCSLCRVLGRQYGIFAKMTLSYDFTFMALLRLSQSEHFCGYGTMRCTFNPLKKCSCVKSDEEELCYTAAVSIILFYYKLKDNYIDSGFGGKLATLMLMPVFSRYRKKALRRYPSADIAASKMMAEQQNLEHKHCDSLDMASAPTADFLAAAFSRDFSQYGENNDNDSSNIRILKELGANAGRWIYMTDALDDLDDDIKHGGYNVIAQKFGLYGAANEIAKNNAKQYAKSAINSYNSGLCDAYVLLDMKRYNTIIGNILYLGMKNVLNNLGIKRKRKSENTANIISERN